MGGVCKDDSPEVIPALWHKLWVHLHTDSRCCVALQRCLKQTLNLFCEYSRRFAACTTPVNSPRCLMLNMNVRCFSSAAGGRESTIKTAAWIQHQKCTSAPEANESEIVMWQNRSYTTDLILAIVDYLNREKERRGLSCPRSRIK